MNNTLNFILQKASAGSGKTFALVKRFLMILLNSDNSEYFKQLLAITFTNKASLEMKERIINKLIIFSGDDAEKDDMFLMIANELNKDSNFLKKRAKNILIKIIHQYSQFSVSTIDKFNLRLMRSFSFELGLSTNFSVELDEEKILLESINLLFEEVGRDRDLTNVLTEFTIENLDNEDAWDLTKNILQTSKKISSEKFGDKNILLTKISFKDYINYKYKLVDRIKKIKKEIYDLALEGEELIESYGLIAKDFTLGDRGGVPSVFKNIIIGKFNQLTKTQNNFIHTDEPFNKTTKPEIKELLLAIQPELSKILINYSLLINELIYKKTINKSLLTQSLFNEVMNKLNEIKSIKNILPIGEFNKIISNHIKNQHSAFIYEKLGEFYKHFFIDEFQDTSTLQWQNIFPLLENSIASDGSVFIVGDIKQSIYSFRGANPRLMIDLIENEDKFKLKVETLETNYRSFSTIVNFNNHFYEFLSTQITNDSLKLVYDDASQLTSKKQGGYVQLNYFLKSEVLDSEEELVYNKIIESIFKCIEAKHTFSDIAILVSEHKDASRIAEFLAKHNIPIITEKSIHLSSSIEIKSIIYCLKFFVNNEDKESLANFCVCLKKLNKISLAIDFTLFVKELIALQSIEEVFNVFIEKLNINLSKSYFSENDLYSKIEKLIIELSFIESKNTYIQTFLDVVFNFFTQNENNLLKFLDFWEQESKNIEVSIPKKIDAVNILTVHASKGLEYPIVIIPDFNFSIKSENIWIPTENEVIPIVYANRTSSKDIENTEIKSKLEDDLAFQQLELFNKIYVATTRAVEKLFIISQQKKSTPNNSNDYLKLYFERFYPNDSEIIIGEFNQSVNHSDIKTDTKSMNIPNSFNDWNSKISIAQKYIKLYKNKKVKDYGNLIHLLMSEIYSSDDIERTIEKNISNGVLALNEKEKLVEMITKIVNHPKLKMYFNSKNITYNERSFINNLGEFLRPDKVIINNNQSCAIIDYKTGNKNESHIIQLNKYQEIFENDFKQVVKILVYLKENKIEIVEI